MSGLVWLVVLLAVNAFFVATEFAVVSARRSQIEPLAERGRRSALVALDAMEHATLMLATTQLGITVCSLLILNLSEPAIHHLLAVPLALTGLPVSAADAVSFVIALVVVSFLHVTFGEMVPKNLSFSMPDRAVLVLATPLRWVARATYPVIWALNEATNGIVRAFGIHPRAEANSTFTLDEVAVIADRSTREGVITDRSGTLGAAFLFGAKRVSDVAVPVDRLVTLPKGVTPQQVERQVARHGFSRYPIVGVSGEPTGYLHLKDVLDLDDTGYRLPVPAKRVRTLASLAAGMELEDALAAMRRSGHHVARVVEGGHVTGVVFLEDVIEELVGEVHDATRRDD
ncbi:MAG TPA: hemolysin family protein [Microbacteriaceae bacterium]|nr:hemolysin family protein [Microbacteriaceae bacterium]